MATKRAKNTADRFAPLFEAGTIAFNAGEAADAARKGKASAIDLMIFGFCQKNILNHVVTFELRDKAGAITETVKATPRDYAKGFRNADGSAARMTEGAYRTAHLAVFHGVKDSKAPGAASVWTTTKAAVATAISLADAGCKVEIKDGKLSVTGGKGDKADAMRAAAERSTTALVKAAKGETGTTGPEEKTDAGTSLDQALRIVAVYATAIDKGDEAPSAARLSYLAAILNAAPAIRAHLAD